MRARRVKRRAFSLVEILALVPILGAFLIIAYQLAGQVDRFESQANASRQKAAAVHDLVRRVQEDVAKAHEAGMEKTENGSRLTLRQSGGTVIYATAGDEITRTEQAAGNPEVRYPWKLDHAQLDFQTEKVGARQVVWILWTLELPFERGEYQVRKFSAAATVSRGGAQ